MSQFKLAPFTNGNYWEREVLSGKSVNSNVESYVSASSGICEARASPNWEAAESIPRPKASPHSAHFGVNNTSVMANRIRDRRIGICVQGMPILAEQQMVQCCHNAASKYG